jgi:5-methylcytosine-specific restriction enzyme A
MNTTPRKDRYSLMRAGYRMAPACELCQRTENLVIDHIVALSQGGSNDLDNLRTLCTSCNNKKWLENVKYTTHLRPETIRAVKRYAFEHEKKDYEVVLEALTLFFQEHRT